MNLNEHTKFSQIDREDMLTHIDGLPEQLRFAWELSSKKSLPEWEGIRQVLIAGMGGSAIGADLLVAYTAPTCKAPVAVLRDYDLPGWAHGPETLVIASSHSGNTEETRSVFEQATTRGCRRLAVTTNGQLAEAAEEFGAALWTFEHAGQPRAAVGFSFGLLLGAFTNLGLIPDPSEEVEDAVAAMKDQQSELRAEIPLAQNPAKRTAGQLIGRFVSVIGSGVLAPVARRWKGQFSEIAKAWAQFEFLPEADHNTLAGIHNPEEILSHLTVLFLEAESQHPRNRLRSELTRKTFMVEGLTTDLFKARGKTPLAHQWTTLHFGDYTAYYLAMSYDMDPTPVEAIEGFKREMEEAGRAV